MPRPARPWFRMYSEVLDNPKAQWLKPAVRCHWYNLLALANLTAPRGSLPPITEIAFRLRLSEKAAGAVLEELCRARLVDTTVTGYVMHDWDDWQKDSDANLTPGRAPKTERGAAEEDQDYRPLSSALQPPLRGDSAPESPPLRGDSAPESPPLRGDSAGIARRREEKRRGEKRREDQEERENAREDAPAPADDPPVEKLKRSRARPLSQVEPELPRLIDEHPSVDVLGEYTKWQLWLKSKNRTYTDYVAAFSLWLRNEEKYARERRIQTSFGAAASHGRYADAADRTEARLRDGPGADAVDRFEARLRG